MLGKIAGLFLLQKTVSDSSSLLGNLLAGMVAAIIFALLSVLLFGGLVLGGVYIGYQALLAAGVVPLTAALTVGGCLLVLFVLCLAMTFICIRSIRAFPKEATNSVSPVGGRISKLSDAFMKGLNTPSSAVR